MKTSRSILTLFALLILSAGSVFAKSDSTIVIKTSAICESCKNRIEKNLSFEKGVKKAELNLDTKEVTVVFNTEKTSAEKIRTAINKTGYAADNMPADQQAYNKLPKCCKSSGCQGSGCAH